MDRVVTKPGCQRNQFRETDQSRKQKFAQPKKRLLQHPGLRISPFYLVSPLTGVLFRRRGRGGSGIDSARGGGECVADVQAAQALIPRRAVRHLALDLALYAMLLLHLACSNSVAALGGAGGGSVRRGVRLRLVHIGSGGFGVRVSCCVCCVLRCRLFAVLSCPGLIEIGLRSG